VPIGLAGAVLLVAAASGTFVVLRGSSGGAAGGTSPSPVAAAATDSGATSTPDPSASATVAVAPTAATDSTSTTGSSTPATPASSSTGDTGRLSIVAGTTQAIDQRAGEGGPAAGAKLNAAEDVTVAPDGDIYIADNATQRLLKISDGILTVVYQGNFSAGENEVSGVAAKRTDPQRSSSRVTPSRSRPASRRSPPAPTARSTSPQGA
jgi:hypothetical protein